MNKNNSYTILFTDHTPIVGGAQLSLKRHVEQIDKDLVTPVVVISSEYPDYVAQLEDVLPGNIYTIPFAQLKPVTGASLLKLLRSFMALVGVVRKVKPDLIVANVERAYYVSYLVSLFLRIKLVLIVRDFEFSQTLLRITKNKVSKYVCVSRQIAQYYQLPNDKTEVVHVGSDFDKKLLAVTNDEKDTVSKVISAEGGGLVIGSAGRILENKGVFLLLHAFQQLLSEQTDSIPRRVKLVYIGTGADESRLRSEVEKRGLSDSVVVVGFVSNPQVWFTQFDIYAHTTTDKEAYPTTIIESAMSKSAIVATDVGGTSEFVINDVTGILIKPNVEELYTALRRLIIDDGLRQELAENAYVKATTENSEASITRRFEAIYKDVLT